MWYVRLIFSAMWVSPDTSQTPPHTRIPPPAPCPPCHCIKKSFRIPHIVAILVFNNLSIVSQFYSSLSLSENNHFWEIHWHCHYVVAIFIFSSLLYVVMVPGHHHSWVTISHYRYFLFSVWILVWRLWCSTILASHCPILASIKLLLSVFVHIPALRFLQIGPDHFNVGPSPSLHWLRPLWAWALC